MLDVLALLLQAWEDKIEPHGWQIMRSVRRSGPAVYRALDRLEGAGWITASWEVLPAVQQRPRRRHYRLTAAGVEAARAQLTAVGATQSLGLWPQPGFGRFIGPQPVG
jgi:DNA-binding PadR family transcriptional regulator